MPMWEMQRSYVLPIQVHSHIMIERDDGQRLFGLRFGLKFHRAIVPCSATLLEALADVILRDDGRGLLENSVPSRVIFVIMRINDEPYRLVRDTFQCSFDL